MKEWGSNLALVNVSGIVETMTRNLEKKNEYFLFWNSENGRDRRVKFGHLDS